MTAFNIEEAARQGRSESISPGWTKFLPSRGTLWLNVISYGLCTLLILGITPFLLITRAPGQSVSPLEVIASLALGLLLLSVTLRSIPPLINSAGHFLLVTADGFVLVAGRKVIGRPFAEISAASREPGLLGAKPVVQQRSGRPLTLPIGRIYGTQALREMEDALTAGLKSGGQSKRKKGRR